MPRKINIARVSIYIFTLLFMFNCELPFSYAAEQENNAVKGVIDATLLRADRYLRDGRYHTAIDELTNVEASALALGDTKRLAAVAGNLGAAYLGTGQHQRADSALARSIELAKDIGDERLHAAGLNNLAALRARQNDHDQALAIYEESIVVASAIDKVDIAIDATINRAKLLLKLDRNDAAVENLSRADQLLDAAAPSSETALRLLALGREWSKFGQTEPAYEAFLRAKEIADAEDDKRLGSFSVGYLAELYEGSNRIDEALQLSRQAMFLAQSADASELLYRWQWQAGRLLAKDDKTDEAIDAYWDSVTTLTRLRPELIAAAKAEGRSALSESVEPVYLELADLLLKRAAATPDREAKQTDLDQARGVIEVFRAAELEDYFQDDCVAELKARAQPIDRIADRTAAIYPIILPERTVLLLSLPDGLTQVSVPISSATLTAEIRSFRELLEKRTTRQYLTVAQSLYRHLIGPLETHLDRLGIDTIVLVPDGPLRTIPLAALHDGQQFLIDRYAVATVPSLALIDPKPVAQAEVKPLINGLTKSVQGYPALPHVAEELEAIADLYGGRVLLDDQFVEAQLEQSLASTAYSVVHIASHGEFAGRPEDSFLLTFDGQINMDGLEDVIKLSRFRDEPVELLTLSACRTAAGDDRAALGLAGLAIKAGARSALATLWFINDQASSLLVAEFYRELQRSQGGSKGKALQLAQLAIKSDIRYRHPAYWAPFLIIGNWL